MLPDNWGYIFSIRIDLTRVENKKFQAKDKRGYPYKRISQSLLSPVAKWVSSENS